MHERFRFKSIDELILKTWELGYELPFSYDLSPLLNSLMLNGFLIPNRFVEQIMEGYNSKVNDPSSTYPGCNTSDLPLTKEIKDPYAFVMPMKLSLLFLYNYQKQALKYD